MAENPISDDLAMLIREDFGHLKPDFVLRDFRKTLQTKKQGFEADNFFVRLIGETDQVHVQDLFAVAPSFTASIDHFLAEAERVLKS